MDANAHFLWRLTIAEAENIHISRSTSPYIDARSYRTHSIYTISRWSNTPNSNQHHHPPQSLTSRQHPPNNPHESSILTRRRHPLLITQLLIHRLIRTMRPGLETHIHAIPRRQRLFQPHPNAQSNHRGQRAVVDCRRELHYYGVDCGIC